MRDFRIVWCLDRFTGEQVEAWSRAESPLSGFFPISAIYRRVLHAGLNIICSFVRVTAFEARDSPANRTPRRRSWKNQEASHMESNFQRCQGFYKMSWDFLFFKSVMRIWKYIYKKINHSASQFSLFIYNHLSHAYIQYIKKNFLKKTYKSKHKVLLPSRTEALEKVRLDIWVLENVQKVQ